MIIWLNGAFGSGKTTCAYELRRRLDGAIVYDPENIGYFLQKNLPPELRKNDFQDHPEWREFNYTLLAKLSREHSGIVIVPMTITSPEYYDEIIGRLRRDGAELRHIILSANRETLLKRLGRRIELGNTWAKRQIDRCIIAFENAITEEKIATNTLSPTEAAEAVAKLCVLPLLPDKRSKLKRWIDRNIVLLKHIR